MSFYQLLFSRKLNGINRNLTWYWNLFAKYLRENVGTLLAKILKIKGNTIVWNQLQGTVLSTASQGGVTFTHTNDYTITLSNSATSGTSRRTTNDGNPFSIINGHKYLIFGGTDKSGIVFRLYQNGWGDALADSIPLSGGVVTATMSSNNAFLVMQIANGTNCNNVVIVPQIIDITKLNDSRVTDLNSFKQYYPLPYYSYSTGSLLSFNGTGIKTKKADDTDLGTLSLPISTYFPDGMLSAGSVYDELTPTSYVKRVKTKDLSELTWYYDPNGFFYTSALDWDMPKIANSLIHPISCANYNVANFSTSLSDERWGSVADKTIAYHCSSSISVAYIYIKDTSFNGNVTNFTNALNGVSLYYATKSPTEVSIDPPLDLSYEIEWGGTEQLLPENTSTPTTSPISATVEYPDGEHEDYYTYQEIEKNHLRLNRALSIMLGRNVLIENPQEPLDILMKGE